MSEQPNENTCVVCFKNVLYYSIGECDHPVCFECSTRMRVLCLQNECPICRQDLSRVVFTDTVQPYKELRTRVFTDRLFERQFKIGFCSEDIKQAYEQLLENRCNICDRAPPFRSFNMLSDHMRKVHEKYFCDLCVKHLKIFTSERKCYTRQELAHHRRKGDLDDTSHRGHPLCEFCEERFMDADELYRHLRKEHLYCHLCDADGKNLYYASHQALAQHFRSDHFLCEEGECAGQHLTAVFRSEIDLKVHKATVHGRGMNRGASRQARTLELQFNITPHPVAQRTPRERPEPAVSPPPPPAPAQIDTRSDEHFPRLSAAPPAPILSAAPHKAYKGAGNLARTDKNFPALGLDSGPSRPPAPAHTVAATIVKNSKPGVSIQVHSQPGSASNFRLTQTSGNRITIPAPRRAPPDDDDFPSLGAPRDDHPSLGAAAPQPPKVAMINSQEMQALKGNQTSAHQRKPQMSAEAFPALAGGAVTSATPAPQWITVSKRATPRSVRAEPPPPRAPAFNPVADFPTLPNNKPKKKQSAPQPQPAPPAPAPPDNRTKKDKKKNNKKEHLVADGTAPLTNGVDKRYARDPAFGEVNLNNNHEIDRKIKTVDTTAAAPVSAERNRNAGNGDFTLATAEYPPLNPKGKRGAAPAPAHAPAAPRAPPGLSARAAPACGGLTFTNSSGQSFPAPLHSYIPPPEFESRNRALVGRFVAALGSAGAVDEFKAASRAFREGALGADELLAHCAAALGPAADAVLPELVALLPDIAKQQELARGRGLPLHVCATCGQLLAPDDALPHDAAHWPPLANR